MCMHSAWDSLVVWTFPIRWRYKENRHIAEKSVAKDGRFFGTTGCNRYFGQYTLDGQNIKIAENMGMTRMFCHDKDEQERKFTQAFPKVVKYEIKGDKVTFTTSDGMKIEGVKAE